MEWIVMCYTLALICTAVRRTSGSCGVRKDTNYDSTTNDASLGEFPWQVLVKVSPHHVCSGTIISEFWVLSSADCFSGVNDMLVMEVGVISLGVAGRKYPILKLVLHAGYQEDTSDNNIALLESYESISYNDAVQPACFPDTSVLNIDSLVNCWVTTWTEEKQGERKYTEIILKKLPFIPTPNCQVNNQKVMCAVMSDMESNFDCKIDSGDALMCQYRENKAWIVAGIVRNTSECGSTVVFTRTASYIAWMKDSTMIEGKPVIPEINPGLDDKEPTKVEPSVFTIYHYEEIPTLEFGERTSITVEANRGSKLEPGNRIVITVLVFLASCAVL